MRDLSYIHLLIAAFLAVVVWLLGRNQAQPTRATGRQAEVAPVIQFGWPELNEYECDIVGESFYQTTLKKLAGEHGKESACAHFTALLVPDNANPKDNKAVRVDINGSTVGYLARDDARTFRRRLSAKKLGVSTTRCGALVMGGFTDKQGNVASYGVRLDIKPFD